MEITAETPRTARKIGGVTVQVPQPYAAGQPLTEATAAMLNQTFAENISNNTRKQIEAGYVASEGAEAQPHTDETAQALIDRYVTEYEPGVRRGGSGEPRVTDPVEREARKLAKTAATELVKANGGKPADFDMADIASKVFEANREPLMAEAKKLVEAMNKAQKKGITLDGIDLTPKAATEQATA